MTLRGALAVVGAIALVAVPAAFAKTSVTFDRAAAQPGDSVTLYLHHRGAKPARTRSYVIYLVRAERIGEVVYAKGGGVRTGPPPSSVAAVRVGKATARATRISIRVPRLAPARYAAVLYCARCAADPLVTSVSNGIPNGTDPPNPTALLTIRG
jgi:hypothetical protein